VRGEGPSEAYSLGREILRGRFLRVFKKVGSNHWNEERGATCNQKCAHVELQRSSWPRAITAQVPCQGSPKVLDLHAEVVAHETLAAPYQTLRSCQLLPCEKKSRSAGYARPVVHVTRLSTITTKGNARVLLRVCRLKRIVNSVGIRIIANTAFD